MRVNQAIVGLLLGLITPVLGFVVVYLVLSHGMGFSSFAGKVFSRSSEASKIISLSVLANLIPFLYFNRRRLDQTVKGIVIATVLYMVFFLYVKFAM